jgi:hypothetical protein
VWLALLTLAALVGLFVLERWMRRRAREDRFIPEEREKQFDEMSRTRSAEIKALRKTALGKDDRK